MSEKKLKILQVHNFYQIPGGEDTVVANEKKMLEDHGHVVVQYTRDNSELKSFSMLKKLALPVTTIFNPKTYWDVKRVIRQEKIDLVHVHNTLNLISPSVYYAALACKVPVVQTVHNFRLLCPGATFYRDGHICEDCLEQGLSCAVKHGCYRNSRFQTLACVINTKIHRALGVYGKLNYICLTEFNKDKLLLLNQNRRRPLVREDRIFVKPNFAYIDAKKQEQCEGKYYLYIGRVEKIKGLDVLVDAFSSLGDLQLKIAGTGTELEYYQQLVEQKNLNNISFLGFLNRAKLQEALKQAKAVIVASQWYETFGMIIVEAYAAHKPVIVGDIGNISSLVESGVTGLKFRYNDGGALAETILEFEKAKKNLGEKAFQRYQKNYQPEVNYGELNKIYLSACGIKQKQKVLIVHNYYQIPGGEDTVVANEKKLLEDNGHEVILYTRHNSELKTMSLWSKLVLPLTTIYNPRTARDIKRLIREEKIDLVHVHNTLNLISPSVYYAALACKVPVVQTVHNFRLLCPGATFYRDGHICEDCLEQGLGCAVKHGCYRNSRFQTLACVINTKIHRALGIYGKLNYICLTEFNKEKLLNLKQIDPNRVFVKPNFVESSGEIIPYDQRKEQFIFAGRIDKLKGIDVLLDAWKLMGASAPKLLICGTGPMEDWCRAYIKQNELTMVEMKGFVPNEEARRLIGESKALILPTQCYEGFPMTIAEVYSVGTPIMTGDLGNAGDLIAERQTGVHFCHHSSESLAAVIKNADRQEISAWQENSYKNYQERYTRQRNYEMLMRIYQVSQV